MTTHYPSLVWGALVALMSDDLARNPELGARTAKMPSELEGVQNWAEAELLIAVAVRSNRGDRVWPVLEAVRAQRKARKDAPSSSPRLVGVPRG